MRVQEWLLAIAIAIVYPLFFGKLTDVITGAGEIRGMCDGIPMVFFPDPDLKAGEEFKEEMGEEMREGMQAYIPEPRMKGEPNPAYNTCYEEQRNEREGIESRQFYILMGVGMCGILAGIFLKEGALSTGISLGSIITLIMATSMYWDRMGDTMKLGVTGVALIVLMFMGYRFMGTGRTSFM